MEAFVHNLPLRKGRGLHLWSLYMLVGPFLLAMGMSKIKGVRKLIRG